MPSVHQGSGRNNEQNGCGKASGRQRIWKFCNDDRLDIGEIKSPVGFGKRIPADAQQMISAHPQGIAHEDPGASRQSRILGFRRHRR
jgi:hypothetical protein